MSDATPKIYFVTGGSRSGKSTHAESIAASLADDVVYVATCRTEGMDDEMKDRVERHQQSRPAHWETVENSFELSALARRFPSRTLLLDCLTLWTAHWMEHDPSIDATLERLQNGLTALREHKVSAVIVSNEIGSGIVPMGPENRSYRDLIGWANQRVAAEADVVDFVVSGIPMRIKPTKA